MSKLLLFLGLASAINPAGAAQFRTGRAMRNRALVLSIFVATIIPAAAQLVPSWQISTKAGCVPTVVNQAKSISRLTLSKAARTSR